jgi:hypothetical protein
MATSAQVVVALHPSALRRHNRLLLFTVAAGYLILLILPWALTCKISASLQGNNRSSHNWTKDVLLRADQWVRAIGFLQAAQVVLAIPVVLFLLDHAAAVHARRNDGMTAREVLALVDRRWGRRWGKTRGFALLAAAVVLLSESP